MKRKSQLDSTEHAFSKNLPDQEGKKQDVPGMQERADEKLEVELYNRRFYRETTWQC